MHIKGAGVKKNQTRIDILGARVKKKKQNMHILGATGKKEEKKKCAHFGCWNKK